MPLPLLTDILPHRHGMLLLDGISHFDREHIVALATPRSDAWYADAQGNMPAYVGIELMAQAVAGWVGLTAHQTQQPVKQGVLLGTRRYQPVSPVFAAGQTLQVWAQPAYRDAAGMGSFQCRIECQGHVLVQATVNVFEPPDFALFLEESRHK